MEKKDLISFILPENPEPFYFVIQLSNGENVFQDKRDGFQHAWLRLKDFLKVNPEIKIVGMDLVKLNGKTFKTLDNQRGYIFGYKHIKTFLGPKTELTATCFGYCDGEFCHMTWLNANGKIIQQEKRTKEGCGFFLIENI